MGAVSPRSRALLLSVTVLLLASAFLVPPSDGRAGADAPADDATQPTPESLKLVTVDPNSSDRLWPYTSRRRSFDTATLPINVVVMKRAAFVRYLLQSSQGATWQPAETAGNGTGGNATDVESGVVLNGTRVEWATARGSTRYSYVHEDGAGRGRWVDETYQLHDGAYLGTRYHLRLYEGGAGDSRWTAIQVHREHWDWFRLRHTVGSVDRAQDYLEQEFYGTWFLESVDRSRYANGGALDADGWVSVIRVTDRGLLAPRPQSIAVLLWLVSLRRRVGMDRTAAIRSLRRDLEEYDGDLLSLALVGSLVLLPVTVRVVGITLEASFPGLSPKVIAAVLYPVLVLGAPFAVYACSRTLEAQPAAISAAAAFGTGMLLDYAYLDISALPVDLLIHRSVLLVAVGLIAAGSSATSQEAPDGRQLVAAGATIWVLGLLFPLLDLL